MSSRRPRPRRGDGEVALVTGVSRGIGRAIAAALAAEGCVVHGTCRDPASLAAADRIPGMTYHPLDLADRASIDALVACLPAVEVLVNNAGESQVGPVEEMDEAALRHLFEVGFFGPARLTRAYAAAMRERGSGLIVSIGSMRSEVPTPFSAAYSAAKAALRSFSDALRLELAPFGVRVCLVALSYVRTTLEQKQVSKPGSPYADRLARARARRDLDIASGADPEAVGRFVAGLLSADDPGGFRTFGRNAPLQAFLARHLPRRMVEAITSRRYGGR